MMCEDKCMKKDMKWSEAIMNEAMKNEDNEENDDDDDDNQCEMMI